MESKSPKSESPIPEDLTSPTSSPEGVEKDEKKGKRQHQLEWTEQIESLLSGWADTAAVYKWLHDKSHRKYKRKNKFLSIPIMVLSLITGSLGIGLQGYVPPAYMSIGQGALGGMGIFIGIMQGLQTQFGWAQRSEKHNSGSLGWGKLHRNIQIELAVEREFRKDCDSFVKVCRMEYDRLTEQSPAIPSDVLEMFKLVFKKQSEMKKKNDDYKGEINTNTKNEDDLILPDICDTIKHTKVYRAAITNPDSLVQNVYNTVVDNPHKETENVVKSALTDRIKELDEKMSGITQFKLASIGSRFAPIQTAIDHQLESERKRAATIHHVQNIRPHRKFAEFEGIPKLTEQRHSFIEKPTYLRNPLGLPPSSPRKLPIDIPVRPNVKNLINKFTINNGQIELTEIKEEEKKEDIVIDINVPGVIEEHSIEEIVENKSITSTPDIIPKQPPVEVPKLDLEKVKKEEIERQNKSSPKNTPKNSAKKKIKTPVTLVFKDED
jgi:hypothetical protein